jgi:hypothetical protein
MRVEPGRQDSRNASCQLQRVVTMQSTGRTPWQRKNEASVKYCEKRGLRGSSDNPQVLGNVDIAGLRLKHCYVVIFRLLSYLFVAHHNVL